MPKEKSFFTVPSQGTPAGSNEAARPRTRACLVDGTYELFRSYFGAPSSKDASGREVGAALGVARSLRALFRDPSWTHAAVAFDTVIESFRNDLYEGYKTGEGLPEDLLGQFPLVEEEVAALGILVLPMIEFEADDGLASAARILSESGEIDEVVIASPDKDLAQCVVGQKVVTWDRLRDRVYDEEGVLQKFGVRPKSIPDFLALVGDAADGYPGISRFGRKSTAEILSACESLERIPSSAADLSVKIRGGEALIRELNQRREEAALFKRLATLREDAPVPRDVSAYALRRLHEL